MTNRWQNNVAVVTGASSGIGAAITRQLIKAGMRVAACARRIHRLEELGNELAASSNNYLPIECNLRDPDSIAGLFASVRAQWGGTAVLVNNAGLGTTHRCCQGQQSTGARCWTSMSLHFACAPARQ